MYLIQIRSSICTSALVFACAVLASTASLAGPLIDQTGNLLTNGSLESGSLDPITGHNEDSAADGWRQWSNSGGAPTTELITEAEMLSNFGVGLIDGDHALRITTTGPAQGANDGGYAFSGQFGNPAWDTSATLTFSGWFYGISGNAGLWLGANQNGFEYTVNSTLGAWEFISVTRTGAPNNINNLALLYSLGGPADFIIDSLWLNYGDTSTHPGMAASVPEPGSLVLMLIGLLGSRLAGYGSAQVSWRRRAFTKSSV